MANRDLTPWRRSAGLTPYGARDPFGSFRREMDRLFDDFFTPAETRSFGEAGASQGLATISPSLDVHETEQAFTVTAELPGIDPKDVRLDLRENALILSGEKRSERQEGEGGRRYSERTFGRFQRVIPFESEVDADRVDAAFNNGVLTVTLPKNAQARDKTRRIEIRGAGGGNGGASQSQGAGQTQASSNGGAEAASGQNGQ